MPDIMLCSATDSKMPVLIIMIIFTFFAIMETSQQFMNL